MADYYFAPASEGGNNANPGTKASPKENINGDAIFQTAGNSFYFKDGSSYAVIANRSAGQNGQTWMNWDDSPVKRSRPRIVLDAFYLTFNANDGGTFRFFNLIFTCLTAGTPGTWNGNGGISCRRNNAIIIDNCLIEGFSNGLLLGGNVGGDRVSRVTIRNCSVGIFCGEKNFERLKRAFIGYCDIEAQSDGISFHDGQYDPVAGGGGSGNFVYRNDIVVKHLGGGSARENCIDVLHAHPYLTLVENTMQTDRANTNALLAVSSYCDYTKILRNWFKAPLQQGGSAGGPAMHLRCSNVLARRNYIEPQNATANAEAISVQTDSGSAELADSDSAPQKVPFPYPTSISAVELSFNTIVGDAAATRRLILCDANTAGALYNNLSSSPSATQRILDIDPTAAANWTLNGNRWWAPNNATPFYTGGSNVAFAAYQGTGKDAAGSYGDPQLVGYLPMDPALSGAAVALPSGARPDDFIAVRQRRSRALTPGAVEL